jgi:molybdopterin-binding protein
VRKREFLPTPHKILRLRRSAHRLPPVQGTIGASSVLRLRPHSLPRGSSPPIGDSIFPSLSMCAAAQNGIDLGSYRAAAMPIQRAGDGTEATIQIATAVEIVPVTTTNSTRRLKLKTGDARTHSSRPITASSVTSSGESALPRNATISRLENG